MTLIRKKAPKGLRTVHPIRDKAEFNAAWAALGNEVVHDQLNLYGLVGTDGVHHYFNVRGVVECYCVPVTAGWKVQS